MSTTLTSMQLRVSIVICAYTVQRWDDINDAIRSVCGQTLTPYEVVLVIDHCPGLLDRAEKAFQDLRPVKVISNLGCRGLSGARNTGFEACSGEVVAFLDDDATAAPDWLERIAADFAEQNVVGVGGLVSPHWEESRPTWFPPEFDWVIGCSHAGMPRHPEVVRNFVGANMAFRREVLCELGGFSPVLGRTGSDAAGCEETELCIRAASVRRGARLIYEPRAQVLHRVPSSRGTWHYFFRRCYSEGVSKARVAGIAGTDSGLSSERTYLRSTVPRAIMRSLSEAIRERPSASLRAIALLAGTTVTLSGYLKGTLSERRNQFEPVPADAGEQESSSRRSRQPVSKRGQWTAVFTLLAVIELWAIGLTSAKTPDTMNDFGLMSVLPATFYASLALLTFSFFYWTRRSHFRSWVLFAHVVVLLAIFHLTPEILYGTLRYSWAWKHVAITDYVIVHHGVELAQKNPPLVAYQDWPGFFTINALLTAGSGFKSAISYASFAPFANELLYSGPLFLIFRTFTTDRRVHWTAIWIFYLGNWVGQDYFSPQGYAFFLYLAVIAITLRYFLKGWTRADEPTLLAAVGQPKLVQTDAKTRGIWCYVITAILMLAIASSHQLTPVMLVSALGLLLIFRLLRYRSLPFVAAGISVGWIALAARTFVHYNSAEIFSGFGAFLSNAKVAQLNPANASPDQLVISHFDYILTGSVILLGLIGLARRWRHDGTRPVLPAVVLTISPIVALAANNYGGEIVFRVFLFGLPFLALLGAQALAPIGGGKLNGTLEFIRVGLAAAFTVAFLFSYYGKERTNYFSPSEAAAIQHLYHIAPAGSEMVGIVGNNPWPLKNYNHYPTYWFSQALNVRPLIAHPLESVLAQMTGYSHSYFLFTTSDAAEVEMAGLLPSGEYQHIQYILLRSGRFRIVENTPSVLALELLPPNQATSTNGVISPAKPGIR